MRLLHSKGIGNYSCSSWTFWRSRSVNKVHLQLSHAFVFYLEWILYKGNLHNKRTIQFHSEEDEDSMASIRVILHPICRIA